MLENHPVKLPEWWEKRANCSFKSLSLQAVCYAAVDSQNIFFLILLIGLPIINALLWVMTLEKEMATHSSILAWRIPWTEKPGGLQSVGLQTVRHNWATNTHTHTHTHTHKHTHESWLKNLIKNIKMCVFYRQGNWGSETLVNLFKVKLSGREGLGLKM